MSVNYRLTDEATVLDCIADCKCAVRWLHAHAEEYNVDPDRIGSYGNSAGAHLVSVLGQASADAKLEGDGPFPNVFMQHGKNTQPAMKEFSDRELQ